MKIKMKTTSANPEGVKMADQIYDIDEKEAKALIKAGCAEEVGVEDADDTGEV